MQLFCMSQPLGMFDATLVRPTTDFGKVCLTSRVSMRCQNSQRPERLSRTPCPSIGPVFGEFVRASLGTKLDQYLPIRLMRNQKPARARIYRQAGSYRPPAT